MPLPIILLLLFMLTIIFGLFFGTRFMMQRQQAKRELIQSTACHEVRNLLQDIVRGDTQVNWRDAQNPDFEYEAEKATKARARLREIGKPAQDCIQALAMYDTNSVIRDVAGKIRDKKTIL